MRQRPFLVSPPLLVFATLTLLALAPRPLLATTFFVDDNGAGVACTNVAPCPLIATAVGLTAAGDVVLVAAGTYPEWGIVIPHPLAIIGASAATVTVDGIGNGPIFQVNPGAGSVLLSRMTLTNGNAGLASGGAIRFSSGDLAITGSQLIGNSALGGGAISQQSAGQLLIFTSLLEDNNSTAIGGAIACNNCGGIDVRLSILRGNTAATTGGAIDVVTSTVSLWASAVSDNVADFGGGIHSLLAPVTIHDSAMMRNHAEVDGGAVYSTSSVEVQRSTLAQNTAGNNGGAVYAMGGAPVSVSNSTFSENTAACGGAFSLIANFGAAPVALMGASTFYGNEAFVAGCGGHFQTALAGGALDVYNSIIDGGVGDNCNVAMTGGNTNLIDDATCDTGAANFNLGAVTGLDPLLAYNGELTKTHLIGVASNAIDAGNNAACKNPVTGNPLTIDQRGSTRPVDFTGIGVATCDIGAVELQ